MKKGCYKICKCGNDFYEYPYLKGKKKFCSTDCANKANAKKNSESKMEKKNPMYGKRPWNYIDGRMEKRTGIDARYWRLRRFVYKRDNQQCQICFVKLKRNEFEADHIKSWAKYPELRYEESNVRTLCKPCHKKTPTYKRNVIFHK